MPGVSMSNTSPAFPALTSTVVPGKLETSTYRPVSAPKSALLPTLGFPTSTIGASGAGAGGEAWHVGMSNGQDFCESALPMTLDGSRLAGEYRKSPARL